MTVDRLIRISNVIGRHVPRWVQATGGNVSFKDGETMWIKASGLRLDEMRSRSHVIPLALQRIKNGIARLSIASHRNEERYSALIENAAQKPGHGRRASMESGMHALLPARWVFHFHSLPALLMAFEFRANDQKVSRWLAKAWGAPVAFIEATRPGLALANKIAMKRNVGLFILEDHGVLIQSDSVNALPRWRQLEDAFCQRWGYSLLTDLVNVPLTEWKKNPLPGIPLRFFFPDTAVFFGRLKKVLTQTGRLRGEPLFAHPNRAWAQDPDVCEIWLATQFLYLACPLLRSLPDKIVSSVADLPAEKYRRAVFKGSD